jgi:phenylacetate-CoA ligase
MLACQRQRFESLLADILPRNRFYAAKFAQHDPADFSRLPFTTKAELIADQEGHPPYGTNLTEARERYVRLHQTSGTSGQPLRWLDTAQSWEWMLDCWDRMFALVGLRPDDRLVFPFSFGPFLGFWTAFEAASRAGHLCLPAGGMSSNARLRFLLDNAATVVCCTPTYALRLAESAREEGIDLVSSPVRALIVAGEPGAGVPETRVRIETAWGARVFDHGGMTEIGPCSIECVANPGGLHILEEDYIAEVIDPKSMESVPAGQVGELVLTNLGRMGSPLIRYRTGDLVQVDAEPCRCGCPYLRFRGGILGRVDEMIHVRGNNVYPSALEALLRRFPEVVEYQLTIDRTRTLPQLLIAVEPTTADPVIGEALVERIERAVHDQFLFRATISLAPPGSMPRYEMKARRVVTKT